MDKDMNHYKECYYDKETNTLYVKIIVYKALEKNKDKLYSK